MGVVWMWDGCGPTWEVWQDSVTGLNGSGFYWKPLFQGVLHLIKLTVASIDMVGRAIFTDHFNDVGLQRHTLQ